MTTYRFGGERLTGIAALLGLRAGLVSLANRFYREPGIVAPLTRRMS